MTSSTQSPGQQWHVRRQRPDARTMVFWFIDADANRITFAQFLDYIESSEAFRSALIAELAGTEAKAYVWEMPPLARTSLAGEFECAVTAVAAPKKVKIGPSKFAAHLRPDESVVAFASPEGDGQLVVPCPKEAEGWYADLAVFVRRVRAPQVHALWQTLGRTAKAALGAERIWLSSSAPGAPWLHLRVGTSAKSTAYARYAR